ncbi:DUF2585 family protein [Rhizobium sp. SSA_523]|uniref:DUF2585 family protein n=1 Tax=Rhizobium sp. SSA_523 TaxID=2952477 RepID=UPI002090A8AA|nr:DUF2585 family protein [Rhizobium sp. SSA_523]MCO5734757.1 DUF2585 family protein [Rhizobium sp. SSA_523]WKC22996.1 DUF2585 family protein [Rhizobium sp. SSA_523]
MRRGPAPVWHAEPAADDSLGHYLLISSAILAAQIGVLLLLGRSWFCSCGEIKLWQAIPDALQNSQQISDPYTFLHIAFGCALFVWLKAIRPHWSLARLTSYAVMSSAIWEICENLPFVIGIFGTEGSGLEYSGDSIMNSIGDTLAVVLGFLLSSKVPTFVAVGAMALLELVTLSLIGDSIIVGSVRILASALAG